MATSPIKTLSWTDRTVRGPDSEHLKPAEFQELFGITEEWYKDRLKEGIIPAPLSLSAKTIYHPWEHAVYFSLWLRFCCERRQNVEKGA